MTINLDDLPNHLLPVRPTNGFATAALVLGIAAVPVAFIPFVNAVAIVLALLALIFALIGAAKARKVGVGTKPAIAGLILAVIAVIIVPAMNLATLAMIDDVASTAPALEEPAESPAPAPEPAAEEDLAEEPAETVAQEQARIQAESYLLLGGFSRTGLIGQLEYENFTTEDAEYAVDAVVVDWNEQATIKAESYIEMGGFSRASLIDQLLYEGFTAAQAAHGADSVGL